MIDVKIFHKHYIYIYDIHIHFPAWDGYSTKRLLRRHLSNIFIFWDEREEITSLLLCPQFQFKASPRGAGTLAEGGGPTENTLK